MMRIRSLVPYLQSPPWFWVFVAFLVSLGRLWELGTSLDPALYGAISRTLARDGKWWSLSASPSLFPQFFEHPFLVMWLNALFFKIFGATDYTARIVGILFGAGSFYYLYRIGELLVNARYASIYCFLTLFSVHYTGRFPSMYLEVPLVFFMLGALYYTLVFLGDRSPRSGVKAGLCLGLAFLTKGLAALPALALVGAVALYRERLKVWKLVPLWACLSVTAVLVIGFCLLQKSFGEYSFVDNYLRISLFQKTLRPGARFFPDGFFFKILQTHPVHVLMALVIPYAIWRRERGLREAVIVGALATGIFLLSQGSLNSLNLHYFYPLYPMINFLSAAGLYVLMERFAGFSFERLSFRIALFYLVLWHALPLPMRRKGLVDFFQLHAPVQAVKKAGVPRFEAVGIASTDWIYRDMSLWYWDFDSRMLENVADVKGRAVVVGRNSGIEAELSRRGFSLCAGSPRYVIMVAEAELSRQCQREPMSEGLIR